jgi:peptidoglycan/LPS O-acetylase OafA/YrhL
MTKRNEALDGLRGWLAVSVCLYHGFLIPQGNSIFPIFFAPLGETASIRRKMILQIINGDFAVCVFFIMSGAVLFGSLKGIARNRRPAAMAMDFSIRRIFRIYPAFIAALCLFGVALWTLGWLFPTIFHVYFNMRQFLSNLSLFKIAMYGASWSLQVELEAVPFLLLGFWIWYRSGDAGLVVYLAIAILARQAPWLTLNLPQLHENLFLFILGMLAIGPSGKALTEGIGDRVALAIPVIIIIGASIIDYRSAMVRPFQGLLATLFIAALLHGRLPLIGAALSTRLSQFLGHISYAFYVINPIFLEINRVVITQVLGWPSDEFLSELALGLSATMCSIPLSMICYRYVELPSIQMGKLAFPVVSRLLQGRAPARAVRVPVGVDLGAASADDTAPTAVLTKRGKLTGGA